MAAVLAVMHLTATNSPAAVFDFSSAVPNIIANNNVSSVSLLATDPSSGALKQTNIVGATSDLVSKDGVAAWSAGGQVYCFIYDPTRTNWAGHISAGTPTFSPQTDRGVVAWTQGSTVQFRVFDQSTTSWVAGLAAGINPTMLVVADAVVSWSTTAGVGLRVYDPARRQWMGDGAAFGAGHIFGAMVSTNGVVAWSTSSGATAGTIYAYTYDPTRGGWQPRSSNTGRTFDLQTASAVAAWSTSPFVYLQVYDPIQGQWVNTSVNSGFASNLTISNSTVYWSTTGGSFIYGYNPGAAQWQLNTLSRPLAAFAVSTNAGNAPLPVYFIDMSLGGVSWNWNFDDNGAISTTRSPFHRYTNFARHNVTQTVTSGSGQTSTTNLSIRSDITAPSGTVVINNGDMVATNPVAALRLNATDNSGVVSSNRFSNDGTTWSPWENYSTNKAWPFSPGNGQKTVSVQFSDLAGNVSLTATDTIDLDTNAPPTVSFVSTNFVENIGTATIQAVLSRSHNQTVAAPWFTSGGTATAGADYTAGSGVLTFPVGTTAASFTVSITPDANVELNETVGLNFGTVTNAIAGPSGTLTILDDDTPGVSFASTNFSSLESAALANVTVQLSAASGRTVTVRVVATNGTALSGIDFVGTNGVITFAPGNTMISFPVPILNDSSNEVNETVSLLLTNPVNAALAPPAVSTLTIVDDDPPTVFYSSSAYIVSENAGVATIQVWLNKPFIQDVFVDYAAVGGTATPGADYVPASGGFQFNPGQTNKSFFVTLFDNPNRSAQDKTIHLTLNNIVGASPGATSQADIVIRDDDSAPRLTSPQLNAVGQFQSTLLGAPGQPFVIQVSTTLTNWSDLVTLTNTAGSLEFTDPTSPGIPARFYRTRLTP